MNKIIKSIITISLSFVLFGCADKVPFTKQTPLDNSALVYVYAKANTLSEDDYLAGAYSISVDSKKLDVRLVEGEYTTIDLKPNPSVNVSATMGAVITKTIILNPLASNVYYLRAMVAEGSNFKFEQVEGKIALVELKKTVLSGSSVEDINDAIVKKPKKEKPTSAPTSKIQKIKAINVLLSVKSQPKGTPVQNSPKAYF